MSINEVIKNNYVSIFVVLLLFNIFVDNNILCLINKWIKIYWNQYIFSIFKINIYNI
jgi:hypothetical protein